MKCKRVLYANQLTKDIQQQLRIIKFNKIKSKKNNVYYVYFASQTDAEYAMKACKQLNNVTIKPYISYASSILPTENETPSSSSTQPKVKLITRCLPPNSSETHQLLQSIDSCLNAMNAVKSTFDEISQQDLQEKNQPLINRLYTQHSTAFYLKMALAIQLKMIFSTKLRLSWSMIASQVNAFERFVDHEQTFVKNLELKSIHLSKTIDFQSSITMSSKLAFQLIKLTEL